MLDLVSQKNAEGLAVEMSEIFYDRIESCNVGEFIKILMTICEIRGVLTNQDVNCAPCASNFPYVRGSLTSVEFAYGICPVLLVRA